MTTMIERCARALCALDGLDPDHQSNDDVDEGARLWTTYVPAAHAVIDALMEPTPEMGAAAASLYRGGVDRDYMVSIGKSEKWDDDVEMYSNIFRAMLSKAKSE